MKDENLIFIVSQPRSGSTLLQAILSNHSRIDTVSEPWLLLPLLSVYKPSLVSAKYDYNLATDAFFDFQDKIGGKQIFKEEYQSFLLQQYAKIQRGKKNYVIDKTPRYYEIFDVIYEFFPNAKFIILKRHPVAVLKSIMTTWNRFSFKELARHHVRDLFVAPFLLKKCEEEYANRDNVKVVKYEELLEDIEGSVKSLLGWLRLDYSREVLNYENNESFKGKYGDPIGVHQTSVPRKGNTPSWKTLLSDKKVGKYLNGYGHFLGNGFLSQYGYKDEISYKANLKFKLFRYYCHRKEYVRNSNYKDRLIALLIRKYLNEEI